MNKIILIGRITKDPELVKINERDGCYSKFSLAVERKYKNTEGVKETDFIPICTWNNNAEYIYKYIKKGDLLSISGRLKINSFEDKEGKKRYSSEVIAEEIKCLVYKKEEKVN